MRFVAIESLGVAENPTAPFLSGGFLRLSAPLLEPCPPNTFARLVDGGRVCVGVEGIPAVDPGMPPGLRKNGNGANGGVSNVGTPTSPTTPASTPKTRSDLGTAIVVSLALAILFGGG